LNEKCRLQLPARRAERLFHQFAGNEVKSIIFGIGRKEQVQVFGIDGAVFDQGIQIQDIGPEFLAVQHDGHLFLDFFGPICFPKKIEIF